PLPWRLPARAAPSPRRRTWLLRHPAQVLRDGIAVASLSSSRVIVLERKNSPPPRNDHSREWRPVQIIFTKKNMDRLDAYSARQRFEEVPETLAVVCFFANEAEHREEIVGPHIARRARHFALFRRQRLERASPLGEKLEGRRVTHVVFRGQILFRQF